MSSSATVIVPTMTPSLVVRLLDSLRKVGGAFETTVIDNGTCAAKLDVSVSELEHGSVTLSENLG